MYYKIFDEETNSYLPQVYNEEDKKVIKASMEWVLKGDLSHEDVVEVTKLKWDQYVVKLKEYGYVVSQQPTPFDMKDIESSTSWEEALEDEYDFFPDDID